jgi:uncharacterized Ntn-hydrolase superfamily protein
MNGRFIAALAACFITLALSSHAADISRRDGEWGPEFTVANGSLKVPGVGRDNPVIYDNDWWLDIIDAGFCVAQHKLGNLDLRGLIVTRDMWPNPPGFTLEDSIRQFQEFRKLAIDSGLTTVPEFVPGARDPLKRPESGRISDTPFAPTPGSNLIISEAKKASPAKPLVLVVGGAPTTVATALLQEPSIAENLIVLWLAIREYNAKDEWGAHVMLMRSPVIHYNFQIRDGLTQEMLRSLPDNPLNNKLKNSKLVYDNGVGDGVLLSWLFNNSFVTGAEKQNVSGLTGFKPTGDRPYGFLHVHNHHKQSKAIAQYMIDVLSRPEVWDAGWKPSAAVINAPAVAATFSVTGFDPATGDLGVAVQSKFFGVGTVVPWAQANVGAIATQSYANIEYGPGALLLLKSGLNAPQSLKQLTDSDPDRDLRQVGIVDANGQSASFTGSKCNPWAGHIEGEHFSVQGNLLTGEEVVRAMAEAYQNARKTENSQLADWLMAALDAGQKAGGDKRGQQSAALLVVRENGGYAGKNDRFIDLRVEDHPAPIEELQRLLDLHKSFYRAAHHNRPQRTGSDRLPDNSND